MLPGDSLSQDATLIWLPPCLSQQTPKRAFKSPHDSILSPNDFLGACQCSWQTSSKMLLDFLTHLAFFCTPDIVST